MGAALMRSQQREEIDGRVAVKLFLAIAEEWGLSEEQRCILAGLSSRTTLQNWRRRVAEADTVNLSGDTLERLSYVAGIYGGLQRLFSAPEQWRAWVRKPNQDFGGRSALDRMLAGRVVDLADTRRYLDAWIGDLYG